ncbi:MAG: Mo-dependent nitrogenase [Coleofasciculaceae cyanobacterium SM2_3_26]|nr:Mo-dependent nitrogenase [Coleofasciculaceae cyanobacterium SM2_3_26]
MFELFSHAIAPLRQVLDNWDVRNPELAMFLYRAIPAQCPFARDIYFLGRCILRIPPLCKLNPFYEQLMGLRFRAMCYLADDLGMDLEVYS